MTHTAKVLSIMISFLSQRKRSGSSHHVYRETIHGRQRTGTAPWQLVLSTKRNFPSGQSQVSREGQWLVHQFDILDSGCWEWEGVAWLYTVKFVCSMNFHRFLVLSNSLHSMIKKKNINVYSVNSTFSLLKMIVFLSDIFSLKCYELPQFTGHFHYLSHFFDQMYCHSDASITGGV